MASAVPQAPPPMIAKRLTGSRSSQLLTPSHPLRDAAARRCRAASAAVSGASRPSTRPSRSRSMPAQAIIAPLSVHNAGGGATKRSPASSARAARRSSQPLVGGNAAADDQACFPADIGGGTSDRIRGPIDQRIADRELDRGREIRLVAGIEAADRRSDLAYCRLQARRTRNRNPACPSSAAAGRNGTGPRPARPLRWRARRDSRARSALPSCRRLRRRHRRALSRDGCSGQLRRRRGADSARPKPAAADTGNSTSSVRRTVRAWASRWLTARNGLPAAQANALCHRRADDQASDQPGPGAAATPSTSPRTTPASASARDISGSRWSR